MIKVEHLYKTYNNSGNNYQVLKDINFSVNKGEFVLLEGVSGSGKSTLLSILAGVDKPSSGNVLILDEPIAKLPDMHISHFRASKIGMVFQNFNLLENLTVLDNVITAQVPLQINLLKAKKMAKDALKRANISHHSNKTVNKLSGGEKQRVAIARAIVSNPKLLLCDEPTANLDRANSLSFIKMLEELNKDGITIIIATHDTIFKELKINHRILNIQEGQIVE